MSAAQTPAAIDRSDQDLIDAIGAGSRAAFEALYHRYRPRLGAFIVRTLSDVAMSEEVYNDVMLAVWRRPGAYDGTSKVSTWIYAIAYRQCLKRLRGRRETVAADEELLPGHSEYPVFEREDLVQRALAQLSPEHRLVVELAYFRGDSYEEIASIADCPVNTVKTRMFYARRRLREILSDPQPGAQKS